VKQQFKHGEVHKSAIDFSTGTIRLRDTSVDAIRKVHSRGPQPFDPDFLQKFDSDRTIAKNRTVSAIRKAHQSPLRAQISFDALGLSKAFATRGMRKVGFPPQSSNASNATSIADTGATNSWKDQIAPTTKPARVGGQSVTDVSRSPNIDVVLAAIKQDLSRRAKRFM
jgi:hypothetical protein